MSYKRTVKILPKWTAEGNLQLGNVVFKRLQARTGGYQPVDARGFQVLLNYRFYHSPEDIAEKVTLRDVLTDTSTRWYLEY